MKTLILLLLPILSTAQFTPDGKYWLLPKDKVPIIYADLQEYKECVNDNIKLGVIIDEMEAENKANTAKRNELEEINRGLIEEGMKLQYEAGKAQQSRWVWVVLGFLGGAYLSSQIK